MKVEQEVFLSFIKALPNGKTCYPMVFEVNKMGTSVEISFKVKLSQEHLDKTITIGV